MAEPLFQDSLETFKSAQPHVYSQENLLRHTILGIRPDGLVFDKADTVLRYVRDMGFTPIFACPMDIQAEQVLWIWRYQLNAASLERHALFVEMHRGLKSLFIILRDDAYRAGALPASVRLWELKGGSTAKQRSGRTLRDLLKSPNSLLTYIHAADEPIDVVREIGFLIRDDSLRTSVFNAMCSQHIAHQTVADAISGFLGISELQRRQEDCVGATSRLLNECYRQMMASRLDEGQRGALFEAINILKAEGALPWIRLKGLMTRSQIRYDRWDLIQSGAHRSELNNGQPKDIEESWGELWRQTARS